MSNAVRPVMSNAVRHLLPAIGEISPIVEMTNSLLEEMNIYHVERSGTSELSAISPSHSYSRNLLKKLQKTGNKISSGKIIYSDAGNL
jgi:hypothetical protein